MPLTNSNPKVFTEEQVAAEIKKAVDLERKKLEKANAGFEITAPVADPSHPSWQVKDEEGKLSNPFKPTYAADYGTFELQVAPFIAPDGKSYDPSHISMFHGKGFTADENIANWVKNYYGYAVREVKSKSETQRALELVG